MSRCIDADALIADCQLAQKQADRRGREFANAFYSGGGEVSTEWWCVEDMIENAPTIEPERNTGHWINIRNDNVAECDQCGITGRAWMNFCPICGADMRNVVEIARDIMHEAIDHSVWSDTMNVEEMHRVVDDKYADMRGE